MFLLILLLLLSINHLVHLLLDWARQYMLNAKGQLWLMLMMVAVDSCRRLGRPGLLVLQLLLLVLLLLGPKVMGQRWLWALLSVHHVVCHFECKCVLLMLIRRMILGLRSRRRCWC